MAARVRPARPSDARAAELLYASAAGYYDAFAGSPEQAVRLLRALFALGGHTASHAVSRVAEIDGETAGVLAGFPAADSRALSRRFVALAARRLPPTAWPGMIGHLRAAARVSPGPPAGSFYVDALAVDSGQRRRGVATALLEDAEALAAEAGTRSLTLDTGLDNDGAQALYAGFGMRERARSAAPDEATARALGGPGFVSYAKSLRSSAASPGG